MSMFYYRLYNLHFQNNLILTIYFLILKLNLLLKFKIL
jgi:hypothetical protein